MEKTRTKLTQRDQHFLVQLYYKKSLKEMISLKGVEIDKLFEQIPDEAVQHYLGK